VFVGRLRRLFARRRLRKGFEQMNSKNVNHDELQHLHQSDDVNTDSDDYTTNHQRAWCPANYFAASYIAARAVTSTQVPTSIKPVRVVHNSAHV